MHYCSFSTHEKDSVTVTQTVDKYSHYTKIKRARLQARLVSEWVLYAVVVAVCVLHVFLNPTFTLFDAYREFTNLAVH